ncbi:Rpn family recombination-promoting nuclease/putative transposase [Orbaceae bacterium ac157xtp]
MYSEKEIIEMLAGLLVNDGEIVIPKNEIELFQIAIKDKEFLKEFIEIYADKKLYGLYDLDSIKIEPYSYTDEDEKDHQCDILCSADYIGEDTYKKIYFYIFVETQTPVDKDISLTLFRCYTEATLGIIDNDHDNEYKDKLPIVSPIFYYVGTESIPDPDILDWKKHEFFKKLPKEIICISSDDIEELINKKLKKR